MSIPPLPPGFELEQPTATIPPPPPGFELEGQGVGAQATIPDRTVGGTAGGLAMEFLGGAQWATKAPFDLVNMLATAQGKLPAPVQMLLDPMGTAGTVKAGAETASDFFEEGMGAARDLRPESFAVRRDARMIDRDEQGNVTGWNMPTPEAVAGTITQSLPMIPQMIAGGGALTGLLKALGMARGAGAAGFGLSNAANVAPLQFDDVRREAEAEIGGQAAFEGRDPTPEEIAAGQARADTQGLTAGGLTALLSTLTGGAGFAAASKLGMGANSLPGALAKGFVADAPFEGIEEAGQSVVGDIARERPVDLVNAAEGGLLGALAGGAPGAAIGGMQYAQGARAQPAPPAAAAPQPAPTDLAPEPTGDLESILDAMLAPQDVDLRGELARAQQQAPKQAPEPQGLGDFLSQAMAAEPFANRPQPQASTTASLDPAPQPGPKPDEVADPALLDTTRRWAPMKAPNGQVLTDAQGRPKRKPVLDYDKGDTLREWLAAEGGINFEELRAYAGADPALRSDAATQYPFGMKNWPTLRTGDQGMGLETLIERMRDTGWLNENELDMADAADMVMRAINGEQVFHPNEGAGARFAREAEQGWEAAQDKATQELAPIGETSGRVDAMAERQALRDQDREESLTLADQAKRWAATNTPEPAPMFRRKDVEPSPPVDSPAWNKFTADTKVRDPQGKVIPLYHGTGEEFFVFDDAKAGDSTQHSTAPLGHFLTPNRELAEGYAGKASQGRPADERVVEAWVAINNPYEMSLEDMQAIDSPENARAVRGWLQSQGYDGIHVAEADNWIAFESGQIKDVAGAGTFDRANPDVRFSRGDGDSVAGMDEDYRGEHAAPMRDSGAPLHDVTGEGSFYPDDVYSRLAAQYYGTGDSTLDRQAFALVHQMRGKPNRPVTIYRAVPKEKTKADKINEAEIEMARIMRRGGSSARYNWLYAEVQRLQALPDEPAAAIPKINRGDWVSILRAYAKDHGESALNGEYRIISKTVKASEIFTNGDSILEWGYDPTPHAPALSRNDPAPDPTLRRADQKAQSNAIPPNLPAAQTEATRNLARRINGFLGGNAQFRAQEVAADSLPDALSAALEALGQATGTRTVIFRNLTPDVLDFNGVTVGDGVLYVNEKTEAPATTIAGHEFVHDLRKQSPELYAELAAEVERQGRVDAYAGKLKRQGDPNAKANALEELTADAVGDALTDRTFLERMAKESGELFKRVADAFLTFLDSLTGRVRDLGSNAYLTDVQAFRDVLADVLKRYEAGRTGEGGAPKFSRAAAVGSPEFRQWFGSSQVVDSNGEPLVVYHGTTHTDIERFLPDGGGERSQQVLDWFRKAKEGGSNLGYMNFRSGSFFSPDPEYAGNYTGEGKGVIYPAYIKAENPIYFDMVTRKVSGGVRGTTPDALILTEGGRINEIAVLDPDQIKSATGNTGAFGQRPVTANEAEGAGLTEAEANAAQAQGDIRFSRKTPQQAEQEADQRRAQVAAVLPQRQGTPGWNYDRSVWEGRSGQLKKARAVLQDKMTAWEDVQKQIESQLGAIIPDAQNVHRMETLMHGRVREALDRQERSQVVPLVEAMRAAKVQPAELEEYLYARHAQERNAEIAKINPRMPDGGSGMTNAEAKAILAKADKAKLDPLAAMVDRITRGTRNRLLAHGLITQDQFDAMDSQYGSYVPLRGKTIHPTEAANIPTSAGRGVDGRRSPVREALGRGAGNRALNILAEVIGDAQRSIIMAEKARVGRAAMRLVLANPNPDLWTVEPVQTEFKKDANGEVYEAVINDWSDPTVVAVRVKGQVYKIQMNLPLAQALTNVGVDQMMTVIRAAGAVNRYLSAVLTKYNPAFTGVNASRDIIFGLTGLAAEHGEAAAIDAAIHYPQAIIAAGRNAAGKSGSGVWDTWAKEFAEAGGKTGYVNMPSVEDFQRMIGTGSITSYSPTGAARVVRALGDAVGIMNDAVENALRLSAYVTLRKRGMSQDKAAEYAKNITVNFNRKGSSGATLNALFLFYNAATQGAMRVGAVLRKPKAWGYLGSMVMAQTVAMLFAMGLEDDDGENLWNKVPDHVKRRNIVIVTPDKGIITIPMPYGFNWFVYAPNRVVEAVMSQDPSAKNSPGDVTGDLLSALVEAFSPMPLNDGAMGLLPTLLRYPVNMAANRNDFGSPIRKDDPYAKSDLPRASMGRPDTLEVFKLTATGLNRLGGGDEYEPPVPMLDFAPEDLEYILKTATGGAGNFVMDVAMLGQKAAGEFPLEARDVPITKRFYQGVNEEASQQALFYQRREMIDRSLRRVRDTFKGKGEDEAQKLLDASPELAGAVFRRNKRGAIVENNGSPQIVPKAGSLFDLYRETEKAVRARNAEMKRVYGDAPASIMPNAGTRERDRVMREENKKRMEAQRTFNVAWTRVVVSAAD